MRSGSRRSRLSWPIPVPFFVSFRSLAMAERSFFGTVRRLAVGVRRPLRLLRRLHRCDPPTFTFAAKPSDRRRRVGCRLFPDPVGIRTTAARVPKAEDHDPLLVEPIPHSNGVENQLAKER